MKQEPKGIVSKVLQVIMPVGSDPGHRAKQDAIARGAEAAGFHPRFPDYEIANPEFEHEHFASQLRSASLVLADVTGERPSCYFEIGFAEALGRPIVLIAEEGTDVHQSAFRHLIRRYKDGKDLERKVFEALNSERDLLRAPAG